MRSASLIRKLRRLILSLPSLEFTALKNLKMKLNFIFIHRLNHIGAELNLRFLRRNKKRFDLLFSSRDKVMSKSSGVSDFCP